MDSNSIPSSCLIGTPYPRPRWSVRHPLLSRSQRQRPCFMFLLLSMTFLTLCYIPFWWWSTPRQPSTLPASTRATRCHTFPADCETTAPFIFDSIYSLAKQWPNTYAPNGHSIVPATFPRNVPLYHANRDQATMKKPTWFAFDVEMSMGIYGSAGITFMHTAIPSRPLNLLYFDGESATLTASGSLDSQTAILRRHIELYPTDDFTYDEHSRGQELCALAKDLKIDGFMRMNAGFEVLVCDALASGIREVHVSNVTVPGNYIWENDPNIPRDPTRQPPLGFGNTFSEEYAWDWVRSGAWHYGSFGNSGGTLREDRVSLDLCGMVTFYDPLLQSLSGKHTGGIRGKDKYENGWGLRKGHRLLDISTTDANAVRAWVKQVLRRRGKTSLFEKLKRLFWSPLKCSNTNWQLFTEVITNSHRSRAVEIGEIFGQVQAGQLSVSKAMIRIHQLSHNVLSSFFQYPQAGVLTLVETKQTTISRCSSLFTSYGTTDSLNDFEGLLKDSIHIVLDRLCHWEWDLLEWSENYTTDIFRNPDRLPDYTVGEPSSEEIGRYAAETDRVLTWLGWSNWVDCPVKCSIEEICYIPMWPVVYSNGTRQGSIYAGSHLTKQEEEYFWSPKCVSREMWAKAGGRGRDPEHQFPDVPGNGGDDDH